VTPTTLFMASLGVRKSCFMGFTETMLLDVILSQCALCGYLKRPHRKTGLSIPSDLECVRFDRVR
jgi:hypothetical protein